MDQFESSGDVSVDAEALVSAVRTSLGDSLRRVVYFTPSRFAVLYARQDLSDATTDATERLVEIEDVGFAERPVRDAVARHETGTDIGPYAFTVRVHERGFVVRVLVGDHGVLFTADEMDVRAFGEAATAVRRLLA
ncbi:MAG: hypothetical protein V5A31_02940 [Haloferacaceae archaeon]|jgi:hypothetical protein